MDARNPSGFLPRVLWACGLGAAILLPSILANEYYVHLANMTGISIILTLSLNLVFGFAGQISVGHAGFYGIGAYVFANAVVTWGVPFFLSVPIALLVCATVGLLIGLPALRLRGFYLAMATLAFGVVVFVTASQWRAFTGGAMGFLGIPRPTVLGYKLASERSYYYLILFSVLIVFWIIHNLRDSDVGRSMVAVRDSESAAGSLGINATKYKLMAFVLASVFAGLAGALYASLARYVNPNNFTLTLSFVILAMVIIGGLGSNLGAILGGVIMVLLPESTHFLGKFHLMVYSFLLILVVIFAPHGIIGLVHKLAPRPSAAPVRRRNHGPVFRQDSPAILNPDERGFRSFFEVRTVSKSFGGLTALHDVSFSVQPGSITGIIGPNGAGKTTLFNIITGVFPPSHGSIVFQDNPISELRTHIISRQGIIRTFQSVNLFPDLTVYENVLIGTHRHHTSGVLEAILRLPSLRRKQVLSQQVTEEVLDITGLNDVREELCRNLPFGRQRIVETARALAARPQLILLDEPAAGLASWEKDSLKQTLLQIRDLFGITIILIEHSVHFVTVVGLLWLAILIVSPGMFTTTANAQEPEIRIGVLTALTGTLGHMGETDLIGMRIAVDEINQRGGIQGKKIKLIVEDNEGNPAKAVTGATKLIQRDNVLAIIGCEVSFTSLAALQATTEAKIVQFSQGATADVMTSGPGLDKYPYFFRMGLGDKYTTKKLIDYGLKHYSKIAVLSDSGPAGQSFKEALAKLFAAAKAAPVLTETHTIGSPDKTPELLKIKAKGADAIIIQAMPGDAISVLKGMNQIGYKAQILGHLGFGETGTLGAAKELSEGVITLVSHDMSKKSALEFIEKYKKRTGVTMEAWGRPMQGYDSVMILAEGLRRANLDKAKLKEAIESIKDHKPVSGTKTNVASFGPRDHDGNEDEGPVLVKIVKGSWVTIE